MAGKETKARRGQQQEEIRGVRLSRDNAISNSLNFLFYFHLLSKILDISLAFCRWCYLMSKSGALSHVWIIRPIPTQGALSVSSVRGRGVGSGPTRGWLASSRLQRQKAGIVLGQKLSPHRTRLPHYIYSVADSTSIQEQAIETSNKEGQLGGHPDRV